MSPQPRDMVRSGMHQRIDARSQIVLHVGVQQGLAGPPGPEGVEGRPGPEGGRLRKLTRGPLSAARVVRADGSLHIGVASVDDATHPRLVLGISAHSAVLAEEEMEVVRAGEFDDDAWAFIPFESVYLGLNGGLVQTLDPTWLYAQVIGLALSPTKLLVDIRPPIFRAV